MTCSVSKITNAGQAVAYYSEKDDYYLGDDTASAAWYGRGAEALGLAGEVRASDLKAVFEGEIHGVKVGKSGTRTVTLADGTRREIPNHTPGWDVTFSAPKSVSVAALVHRDERLVRAHDAAVREAMAYIEAHAIVTRQRDGEGAYAYKSTGRAVAALVRHASSRNLDPQLHTHAVLANMTLDSESGKWLSIDSRAELFKLQIAANNVYMNALAGLARDAGYSVDWRVRSNRAVSFELGEIAAAEAEGFSTRSAEIEAALKARGLDRASASAEAREAATLDTRSPKEHLPAGELHARWRDRAAALGAENWQAPTAPGAAPKAAVREAARLSARNAVLAAAGALGERETRFTERQIVELATTFAAGSASQKDMRAAVSSLARSGQLVARDVESRDYAGDLKPAAGYTTAAAIELEKSMLESASALAGRSTNPAPTRDEIDAALGAQEKKLGLAFSAEQIRAACGIAGGGDLQILQGYAGTAKTTSVLASLSFLAQERGEKVYAMAPTHSAADTLGEAINAGGGSKTVAAFLAQQQKPPGGVWIVDEAGLIDSKSMRDLLAAGRQAGAKVVLVGDEKQIQSVGAGAAFAQLKAAQPAAVHELVEIKRQRVDELKAAVYDSIRGDFTAALGRVDVREQPKREDGLKAVAAAYREAVAQGKSALIVTLSRDDRRDVNALVQTAREAAGEVTGAAKVKKLEAVDWTAAERRDPARYAAGQVIVTRGTRKLPAEKYVVERVEGDRVFARSEDGKTRTFKPADEANKYTVARAGTLRVGAGDSIVLKAGTDAVDVESGKRVQLKNGAHGRVEAVGGEKIRLDLGGGKRVEIDARAGVQIDLGYAETANQAQGRTTDVVIAAMRSTQTKLADRQRAYVSLSRARERAVVVTDNAGKLAGTLEKSSHGKQKAMNENQQKAGQRQQQEAAAKQPAQQQKEPARTGGKAHRDAAMRDLIARRAAGDRAQHGGDEPRFKERLKGYVSEMKQSSDAAGVKREAEKRQKLAGKAEKAHEKEVGRQKKDVEKKTAVAISKTKAAYGIPVGGVAGRLAFGTKSNQAGFNAIDRLKAQKKATIAQIDAREANRAALKGPAKQSSGGGKQKKTRGMEMG